MFSAGPDSASKLLLSVTRMLPFIKLYDVETEVRTKLLM